MRNTDPTHEPLSPAPMGGARRGNHFSNNASVNKVTGASNTGRQNTAAPDETGSYTSAYFASTRQEEAQKNNPPVTHQTTRPRVTRPTAIAAGSENHANGAGGGDSHRRGPSSPYYDKRPPRKQKRGRVVAGVIGIVAAIIVIVGGICGFCMLRDYQEISAQVPALMEDAGSLKAAAMTGDGETVHNAAAGITGKVSDIHSRLESIPWKLASLVPVIGGDVSIVRTVAAEADRLCQYALIPGCDSLGNLNLGNLMNNGAINVSLLQSLADTLQNVAPVIQQSAETIDNLPEPTIGKVREAVTEVQDIFDVANSTVAGLNEIAPHLPQILGADEPRHYLILAQNSSELRSTGGFPGSAGILTIANGSMSLGEFVAMGIDGMQWYDTPGFGVTDEELTIFGDGRGSDNRIGRIPADTNIIPDFSRVSQIISAMWTDQQGGSVDGVIAIDTVFLQQLLALTGSSIQTNGFNVDGTNAAQLLIHDVYNELTDTDTQDSFFSDVAGAAFGQLTTNLGNADLSQLIQTLSTAISEHRFQVWMSNSDEESVMVKTGCSGIIPTDPATPELGVYVSDDTYSKIAWFLSLNTTINSSVKNADGTTTYNVTTMLTNHLDPNEAYNQVDYITGYNTAKRNRSDMIDKVYLFAPAGGSISDVTIDGYVPSEFPLKEGTYNGNQVWYVTLQTSGLETSTITYNVTTAANAADLTVRQTPTAQEVAGWQ